MRISPPLISVLISLLAAGSCWSEDWILQDKTELHGDPVAYDFETKQLTIIKVDHKEHIIDAGELTFASKWKLIWSEPFGKALNNYSPPVMPIIVVIVFGLISAAIPTLIGIWGAAFVLGSEGGLITHFRAFVKALIVVVIQFAVIGLGLLFLDSDRPLIPDKNADVLLILMTLVLGLLSTGLVLSVHYKRSYRSGLGITLISGVFASIVFTALMLVTLFALQRMYPTGEQLITQLIFEPLDLF